MQIVTTGVRSFACSQALDESLRVKYDASLGLVVAGATDHELGVLAQRHIVEGLGASEMAAVVLPNAPGTIQMVAAGPIALRAVVHGAAAGKIDDADTGNPIGIALEEAGADGDLVEVLRMPNMDHTHS
jgi:hypothetical protein